MKLDNLQNLFYDAVFERDENSKKQLDKYIKAPKHLISSQGLDIYRGSIIGQLCQTLSSIYPVCCRLLGEEFFEATSLIYIRSNPCLSPDLGDYGASFADFLADFEPTKPLIYLPDVARLEWFYHLVFQGEDNTKLDIQALNRVSPENWEKLRFYLPKNSFLWESPYPIHRIWQVNQPDYQGEEEVNLEEGGIKIFLWRQDYNIRMDFPTLQEWKLLQAFAQQQSLEAIARRHCTMANSQENIDLDSLLPLFVKRGWIVNFSISQSLHLRKNPP
jgi:hypothetical protein